MRVERRIIEATWDNNGDLEPLFELEDIGGAIQVTVDLPRVKKEDVAINMTADTVEIIAKMSEAVCWERWGSIQKRITFQTLRKQIRLPEPIDPKEASASFKSGILQIVMPKVREKVWITIE
ncbi:MAG: Hsp20/alpha crystallin family protein [Halobacteriota archaeon]